MRIIDFHSHIFPRADHGSDGPDTTAKQLSALKAAGVDIVAATPHFYPSRHNVTDFLERRDRAYGELTSLPESEGIRVMRGAEVLVCPGIDRMDGFSSLCLEGTSTVLLEMPLTESWGSGLLETVESIRYGELTPVMAHIDRYTEHQASLLSEIGVSFQLNASALCRLFGKKRFLRMIEDGRIVALGSDLHGAADGCMKPFQRACRVIGEDALSEIMKKSAALAEIE